MILSWNAFSFQPNVVWLYDLIRHRASVRELQELIYNTVYSLAKSMEYTTNWAGVLCHWNREWLAGKKKLMDSRFPFLQISRKLLSKGVLEMAGSHLGRDVANPDGGFPQSPRQMLNTASFNSKLLASKSFPAPHSSLLLPVNTI